MKFYIFFKMQIQICILLYIFLHFFRIFNYLTCLLSVPVATVSNLNGREPKTSVEKDGGKSESVGSNQGGCPKWQGALGGR